MGGEDDADTRGGSIEDLPRETMERAWRATRRDGYSAWRGHFARFAVALGITSHWSDRGGRVCVDATMW